MRIALALVLSATCAGAPAAQSQRGAARSHRAPDAPAGNSAERRQAVLSAARRIMLAVRYCAVISSGESRWPQARTVDPFPPDEADERMRVWFATNPSSRKVAQIRRQPRVTLHYFDAHAPEQGYATLLGRARLVNDKAEKARRWKEGWEAYWPDRGDSYLLVEVTPERIEVFSPKHGVAADPVTWQPAAVEMPRRKRREAPARSPAATPRLRR